ncbi:YneF family protein [Lactovum miscens]|uniref:Uncharacterized protein n=1 Tax=Lactovum miscens TaxID=190387 RepID=A0A841CA51_9LACT|nr:YneF family protein [Lactovum miscens]MBB5888441.1 hypothetical protein [Lactovum miscens]
MNIIIIILVLVIGALAGFAGGVWTTQRQTKKMLLENPPLNEDSIRMMMSNMGRKPSEVQVQQTLRQIRGAAKAQANKKKK